MNIKRLSVEELEKLSTERLLSLLKKVRKSKAVYGYQVGIEGDSYYEDFYHAYNEYFNDIKSILSLREHIAREQSLFR